MDAGPKRDLVGSRITDNYIQLVDAFYNVSFYQAILRVPFELIRQFVSVSTTPFTNGITHFTCKINTIILQRKHLFIPRLCRNSTN